MALGYWKDQFETLNVLNYGRLTHLEGVGSR
jgi:hypothetical protein